MDMTQFPNENPGFVVWLKDNPDGFLMFAERWNVHGSRIFFWEKISARPRLVKAANNRHGAAYSTAEEPYWDVPCEDVLLIQRWR